MTEEILEVVNGQLFGVWFLIGAALVFWMQAGFAMCEAGFTRAKNTGNILMKNLMDFCIGTIVFILIGFGLLLGEDIMGLIGRPGFDIFTDYANFDFSNFVFNLVFCATTATIVSGAMAERTRFISYCVYSAVISAVIYPIEAHWTWGGGWLSVLGFHDFAGSNCIHMVGGICALIGAAMLGPRIGKFVKNDEGKVVKINAFPGHNLPLACLGVFILWLGWYGFNGAACTSVEQLGSVFLTTTVAPAIATVVCMIVTWVKYGKPDVSMCLNASLAGLVAITAGCDVTDCLGAIIIGAVAGVLVVFGVWFCDYVIHVDDPVGAVAVHMMNGIWGTIAVGLFATTSAPMSEISGLFYGGGAAQLIRQLIGCGATIAWTAVTIFIAFSAIKAVFGLRVSAEEEITGLDETEHGLASAYAGFSLMDISNTMTMEVNENTSLGVGETGNGTMLTEVSGNTEIGRPAALSAYTASANAAVSGTAASAASVNAAAAASAISVNAAETAGNTSNAADAAALQAVHGEADIHKVVIITKLTRYDAIKKAMNEIGVTGMTVTQVMGCGIQKGAGEKYRGVEMDATLLPQVKLEIVVSKIPVDTVIETAKKTLYTGNIGDGKIFVYSVSRVVKVRTGEEGYDALQDVE